MKRLLTVIAFCATTFAAASAFTTPAAADSGRHGSGLFAQGSNGHFVLSFFSGDRRHKVQRAERRHQKMRRHQRFQRRYARRDNIQWRGQRQGQGQRLRHERRIAAANCHQVQQHGFDRRGYRVLFGSVRCYDAYGRPYVVDGSRTIIRRY